VNRKLDIRRKLENTLGRIRVESLWVDSDIPDTRSGVLGIKRSLRVEEALLASSMCTDQGSESMGFDSLVFEKLDEAIGIGVHVWEKILDGGGGIVFAANAVVRISTQITNPTLGSRHTTIECEDREGKLQWQRWHPSG
jgi:hypothetical protein